MLAQHTFMLPAVAVDVLLNRSPREFVIRSAGRIDGIQIVPVKREFDVYPRLFEAVLVAPVLLRENDTGPRPSCLPLRPKEASSTSWSPSSVVRRRYLAVSRLSRWSSAWSMNPTISSRRLNRNHGMCSVARRASPLAGRTRRSQTSQSPLKKAARRALDEPPENSRIGAKSHGR